MPGGFTPQSPPAERKYVPTQYLSGAESVCDWLESEVTSDVEIYAPNGTIICDRQITKSNVSNVRFTGPGVYTCSGRFSDALWRLTGGCTDWVFDGIQFDANADEQPADVVPYVSDPGGAFYNLFVHTTGGTNKRIHFRNCRFIDLYTDCLFLYQVADSLSVTNCEFTWTDVTQSIGAVAVHILQNSALFQCDDNRFLFSKPTQGGLFDSQYGMPAIICSGLSGAGTICRNLIKYAGRNDDDMHRVGCIDLYGSCADILIEGNDMLASHQPIRVSRSQRVRVINNNIKIFSPAIGDSVPGIEVYTGTDGVNIRESTDITVDKNTLLYVGDNAVWNPDEYGSANFRYDAQASPGIQIACADNDYAAKRVFVTNNTINNVRIGIRTYGSVDGVKIDDNEIIDAVTYMTHGSWTGTGDVNERYKNIAIRRNNCHKSVETPSYTTCTVDNTTDTFTAVGHGLTSGDRIYFKWTGTNANKPGGLFPLDAATAAVAYYALVDSPDTFRVERYLGTGQVDITSNGTGGVLSFTESHDCGGGGLVAGNHVSFTGINTPLILRENYVEGNTLKSGSAYSTFNIDVLLYNNRAKYCNRAFYCRGLSTNTIRKNGNNVEDALILEDFGDAVVINEQAQGAPLDLTALSPVFVFDVNRRVVSGYAGSAIQVRSTGDTAFTCTAVDDVITSAGHGLSSGDMLYVNTLTGAAGLAEDTLYYVRDATTDTFKVETSIGGGAVNITTDGSGNWQPIEDVAYRLDGAKNNTAMLSLTGENSGRVRMCYEQSGNANHLLQASASKQALIVNAGSLVKLGNVNSPLGESGAGGTHYAGGSFTLTDFTFFTVAYFAATGSQAIFNFQSGMDQVSLFFQVGVLTNRRGGQLATIACDSLKTVVISGYNSDTELQLWLNQVAATPNFTGGVVAISGLPLNFYALTATTYNASTYCPALYIIPGRVSDADRDVIERDLATAKGVIL